MLNYLVRLGWSHGDQEIFSVDEMIDLFDVKDVNQSASSFNPEKLLWINQQHIIAAPAEKLGKALVPFLVKSELDPASGPNPEHIATAFHERAETLLHMAAGARYCYEDFEVIDEKSVKKHLRPVILEPLKAVRERLAVLEHWGQTAIHEAIEEVAADYEINLGKIGQPIRVAVTGGPVSPPIDITLWLVGQDRTIRRIDHAIGLIAARASAST
jgi:glutamyl-tRNA synthetase